MFEQVLSLLLLATPLALAQPAAAQEPEGLDKVDGDLTTRDAQTRYTAWFAGEQLRRVRAEVVQREGRAVEEYELEDGSLVRYRTSGTIKGAGAGQGEVRVEIDFDDRGGAQRIEHRLGGVATPMDDAAVRDVGTRLASLHNAAYHLRAARRGSADGLWGGEGWLLVLASDGAVRLETPRSGSPLSGRWHLDGGDRVRVVPSDPLAAPGTTVWRMQGETLLAVEGGTPKDLKLARTGGPPGLAGTSWQWRGMVTPVERIAPDEPARYTLRFRNDAQAEVQADCNRAGGRFDGGGGRIAFGPMMTTMAECPPGSLSSRYLRELGRAVIYRVEGDKLRLELPVDSGVMEFTRQP